MLGWFHSRFQRQSKHCWKQTSTFGFSQGTSKRLPLILATHVTFSHVPWPCSSSMKIVLMYAYHLSFIVFLVQDFTIFTNLSSFLPSLCSWIQATREVVSRHVNDFGDQLRKDNDCALIVNGKTLKYALSAEMRKDFMDLCISCKSVICCRVSPMQKAEVSKKNSDFFFFSTFSIYKKQTGSIGFPYLLRLNIANVRSKYDFMAFSLSMLAP